MRGKWLVVVGLGVIGALLGICFAVDAARAQQDDAIVIYFFWGDGCPHCAQQKPFLEALAQRYPQVEVASFEVWYDAGNQQLLRQMGDAFGFEPAGVPATFIGEHYWVGFSEQIAAQIESYVALCATSGCPDAGVGVVPGHEPRPTPTPNADEVCTQENADECAEEATSPPAAAPPAEPHKSLSVPVLGEIDLEAQSLWASTALIGFVDGFNPCSLWVLSILIALTLHTGSRRKIFVIGLIYITVTAGIYVLFIAGLFTMLTFISFLSWIQAAVSVLALFFAAVNIKDYFWYKEGLSFTIDDEKKPGIYKRIRKVMNAGDSLWSLAVATAGLGVGVSLVEFSCTAGFPVLWTNLVAAQNVTPVTFVLLLLLYMLIYQIDELGIFLVAVFTLRASRLEEKHGRILKLIGGMLMLTLSAVMLVNPALMSNLGSSLVIFGVAFGVAMLVLVVHRVILPRLGIYIGSEMQPAQQDKASRRR
jgi:thiol-disulfide isomerase/thioredoxin